MAKVQVQVAGGSIMQKEAHTLGELQRSLQVETYTAKINGESENDGNTVLEDYQFITFATANKGA